MTTALNQHDLENLFDLAVDVLCVSGPETNIIGVNPAFVAALGYAPEDVIGKPFLSIVHPDDVDRTITAMSGVWDGSTMVLFENRVVTATADVRWFQWSARADSVSGRVYGAGRDITNQRSDRIRLQDYTVLLEQAQLELNAALEELTRIANTDQLTGVLNRRAFQERALEEVSRSGRDRRALGLAMFDIDKFKPINDEHGHPVGDAVLREVVHRMDGARRQYDVLGRWGGEEFVVLFPDSTPADALLASRRIAAAVSASPVVVGSITLDVRVSGGVVSRQGSDVVSFEHLVSLSDQALLKAKRTGRDRVEAAPEIDNKRARLAS